MPPTPPTLPHGLTRQSCTCTPESSRLSAHPCPACHAWTHNTVLLADGCTIPSAAWLDALKPPPGEIL